MSGGHLVEYPLFLSNFKGIYFSLHIFEKYSYIKLHENLSSGSRVVPCGERNGRKDMTEPLVAYHNYNTVTDFHDLADVVRVTFKYDRALCYRPVVYTHSWRHLDLPTHIRNCSWLCD